MHGKPQQDDTGFVDSGCSRYMTGNIAYLSNFNEFVGGYVTFGGGAHGGRISGKGTLKTDSLDFEDFRYFLKFLDMKNIIPKESLTCLVAKAKLDESMLWHGRFTWVFFLTTKDETGEILKNFIKEIENLVDKKVKIIKSNNGTEFKNKVMDDFCREKGIKREYSIARTPQQNGVAERRNMTLIKAVRTMSADSKLPTTFWAEAVKDGPDNKNDEKDKPEDDRSPKEVNIVKQHVNTASLEVNTGSFKLNTIDPSVSTASSNDQDSPKDMFKLGTSHTLETTHVEFFSDEDEPEVYLGNITNSYTITLNTRIHKDHLIKNVIGDVKSSIQTRRMTKPTSKQGFLSAVYEQKTHDILNTYLYVCFLSQIEPTSIAKALSDSSWVEAMQEELLQFKLQQVWILVDLPIG
ncbi:putative ribonuclease H-like domain-containing protein, partial [Tanacetum coccineum]